MKCLLAVIAFFFLAPMLLPAQDNIVVLPPMAVTRIPTPPPPKLKKIVVDFRNQYQQEIKKLARFNHPPDLWTILVTLMPEEKTGGWCINVIAVRAGNGQKTKPIEIAQIPITDKVPFDPAAAAKKAAQKTEKKIGWRSLLI